MYFSLFWTRFGKWAKARKRIYTDFWSVLAGMSIYNSEFYQGCRPEYINNVGLLDNDELHVV